MTRSTHRHFATLACLGALALAGAAAPAATARAAATATAIAKSTPPLPAAAGAELRAIQSDWAKANYATDAARKAVDLEALVPRTDAFVNAHPDRAEPLIWQGIVLSSLAGAKGGLGALGLARQARSKLEAALALDPRALDGSGYTSLGALYYKVPGFPLGFGDAREARRLLQSALAIDPDGIDANYFYGEFLFEEGEHLEARAALERALAAPPRADRALADQGRRGEIEALLARVRQKLD